MISTCFSQTPKLEYYNKAVEYAAQGRFEKAKKEIEKGIEIGLSFSPAKSNLETIEDVIGQKIKKEIAIQIFKGIDYGNKGMLDEAIAEFNRVIANEPNYADTYFYRGSVYYFKGQYDQAISDFSKVTEIKPNYADAYLNRGVSL